MNRQVNVVDTFGNSTVELKRIVVNGELQVLSVKIDTTDEGTTAGNRVQINLTTQFEIDQLIAAVRDLAKNNPPDWVVIVQKPDPEVDHG